MKREMRSAFFEALAFGHISVLRDLFERGLAHPNDRCPITRWSALQLATYYNNGTLGILLEFFPAVNLTVESLSDPCVLPALFTSAKNIAMFYNKGASLKLA